ncbi:hypothetical protein [Leptolyngbya sp. PCC 6406]|uniref:hypothetical protein n=1 Tax=Leptolyngbya sp. PCC 6406 TaxID=1173264 RepID=UPI0002ACAA88|nr:hypothetical protein [Leptolyngbya sp. PCC 6406]
MPEATLSPLVEAITEQLKTLSAEELHTIQEFVDYLAWKRQQESSPAPVKKKSAEERAIERLKDEDDPTKWITVIDEGEEIDEEALNDWLVTRGYQD